MKQKQMSKSVDDYLSNEGWSSRAFVPIAKVLFKELPEHGIETRVGRTVVHLVRSGVVILKCHVHYEGRSRNVLTVTTATGHVLHDFTPQDSVQTILDFILESSKQKLPG
jgi:hypothetical protein